MAVRYKSYTVTKAHPDEANIHEAGTVYSESETTGTAWNFANLRADGGAITGFRMWTDDLNTNGIEFKLQLYDISPANVSLDDASEYDLAFENEDNKIGEITFTPVLETANSAALFAQNFALTIPIEGVSATGHNAITDPHVFGVLTSTEQYTPTAEGQIAIELIKKDE